MNAERGSSSRNPFIQFITESLDLHAIEAVDTTMITEQVRAMFEDWLMGGEELSPADYLDEMQEQVRRVLAGLLVQSPIVDTPELAGADRGALEYLLRLAITLAFAFQTELADITDSGEPRPDDDYTDARRLRRMLMIAMVYARREALRDDVIAHRIVRDGDQLLDATERLR